MATAWLGRSSSGREVVLKVPLEATADMAIKLRDEAQAGFRIRHPNVVETIDYFLDLGRPVLVVDYIDGCPLRDLRRMGGRPNPLPPAAVAWLGRSIAEGLAAIHEAVDENGRPLRMLHRDVTPSNVLLGKDGVPRLIDLGIARSSENQQERTQVGMLKGTLRYVAPELLAGEPYSAATDLWSLGVCLFEAALGRHMVTGEAVQIFRQLTMGTYRELRDGESLHPDLAVAIFALVTDVTMRLRNARAAAAVFARLEQKLIAEDPHRYSGQAWLQSWVPWAHENDDDREQDSASHARAPAAVLPPTALTPPFVATPEPPSTPALSPAVAPPLSAPPRVRTVLGDERFGTTPTIAMAAAPVSPSPSPSSPPPSLSPPPSSPPSSPAPASPAETLVLPRSDVGPPAAPAETLVLPRLDLRRSSPEPAATLVLPQLDLSPSPARPAVDVVVTVPDAPRSVSMAPAETLVLPQVDAPLPPVRAEVAARAGIGLGVGPRLVLPKVDIRPSSPGVPLSSLTPERLRQPPRLVDDETRPSAVTAPLMAPAAGDVLPEGAATVQMGAWTPPEAESPSSATLPSAETAPSSQNAAPTVMMPAAAIPARPSSEAAPTVQIEAWDPHRR